MAGVKPAANRQLLPFTLFQLEHQPFEVGAFRVIEVCGVVGALREVVEYACWAAHLDGGGGHGVFKEFATDYL